MYANNLDDAFSVFASGTTEEWVKSDKYMDYPEYHDEDYTYIEGRTIGDITAQVSVQGEAYSQYISFMINRYYDGIDLIGMSIWIHYELKDGSGSEDSPVNVMYNDSNIKFGWIIPEKATQQVGEIKIGVWVNGTAPNTKAYILKTEEKIYTIHPGLIPGSGITQPDSTWFENFANQMDSKVFIAQGHANDAQASKTAAADSATESAKSATASARALEENKAYVESQKEAFAGYNRRETDLKYANALIGSASGTTQVTVSDAWEAPIPGLEIAGKSEQITTKGLQMLDANTLANKMLNANTGVETVNSLWVATDYIPVVAGQQYKLTTNSNKYLNYALFFDENKIIKEGAGLNLVQNSGLFTVPEDVSYVRIRFYNGGNDLSISEIIDSNPMLNLGVTAQPYEPYTSGKPSPSPDNPQEIVSTDVTAVTVKNKNLTGPLENGSVDASGNEADDKSALRSGWISINPGKTYTFSRKKTFAEESKRCMGRIYDIDKNFLGSVTIFNNTELKKVISNSFYYSGARYIRLVQFKGNDETYDGLDLQMEEGDTVTDYEPPMLRTAAITLTEPLRGIGDYRDRIMCRGGVWGIERNISMDILTEDTVRPSAGGMNSTYPNCIIDNRYTVIYSKQYSELSKKGLYSDGKKTTGYCNIAPAGMVKDWSVVSGGLDNVYSINGLGGIYIAVPITVIGVTATATMDEVNAAIKQYVADNDVYVMFVLDAPTWEPLPAATQSALNALTTYTGQTTITVTADGPEPDVQLWYVQDTNIIIAELKKLIEGTRNVKP